MFITMLRRKWQCQSLSCVWFFATSWTVAHQAPLSMKFSRQEYWSGLPFPSSGDLPDPGIKPKSPALQTVCNFSHKGSPTTLRNFLLFPLCWGFGFSFLIKKEFYTLSVFSTTLEMIMWFCSFFCLYCILHEFILYAKPTLCYLHKSHLVMVYNLFYVLLDLVWIW